MFFQRVTGRSSVAQMQAGWSRPRSADRRPWRSRFPEPLDSMPLRPPKGLFPPAIRAFEEFRAGRRKGVGRIATRPLPRAELQSEPPRRSLLRSLLREFSLWRALLSLARGLAWAIHPLAWTTTNFSTPCWKKETSNLR